MTFETLSHPIRWVFLAHALAGALALGILFIPIFSKKGGKTHTRTGWVYTLAMGFVSFSAFMITPWRALFDPTRTPGSIGFSIFLFFIAVFTLCALWFGLIVLRFKGRKTPSTSIAHLGPPTVLVGFAIATQITGIALQNVLLILFPFIAITSAIGQLRYWKRTPTEKMHWWYAHMSGMMTACIATITAFLVTALPRLWNHPIAHSPALWIAPGLILGAVSNRWIRSYQLQFKDQ